VTGQAKNNIPAGFWKDKKVFITGHTGFKGSWLCLWLHELGAQVTGYALDPPTDPSFSNSAASITSSPQSSLTYDARPDNSHGCLA
jgi:CDP-glucose 4,6-dehydratase